MESKEFKRVLQNLHLENLSLPLHMQKKILELVNSNVSITSALIKDLLQYGKYNEQVNDDFLLEKNLLNISSYEELERAEALAFSLRATELEKTEYAMVSLTLDGFKELHHYLFQDIYSFAGEFRDVQIMKGTTRFCQVQ
ncbi:hypothetical protein [Sporosarcina gallistercoris]|nr:hypothetical protein [Sporosarcina gallistercoris]